MNNFHRCSVFVLLMVLPALNAKMLPAVEREAHGTFHLECRSWSEGRPFTGIFTISPDGSYQYVKEDDINGAVVEFKGTFSGKDMGVVIDTLVNKNRFFSINPDVKSGPSKMDMGTTTVSIKYKGKTNTIGGYGAVRIEAFSPVIQYVFEIIDTARKNADKEDPGKTGDFSLEYISRGSELPVETVFIIKRDGSYKYTRRNLNSIDQSGFSGKIPQKEMEALVDSFINKFKFFSLPPNATGEILIMDEATSSIEITYKGKTHKISGYAAASIQAYSAVMNFMMNTVSRLEKNKK